MHCSFGGGTSPPDIGSQRVAGFAGAAGSGSEFELSKGVRKVASLLGVCRLLRMRWSSPSANSSMAKTNERKEWMTREWRHVERKLALSSSTFDFVVIVIALICCYCFYSSYTSIFPYPCPKSQSDHETLSATACSHLAAATAPGSGTPCITDHAKRELRQLAHVGPMEGLLVCCTTTRAPCMS